MKISLQGVMVVYFEMGDVVGVGGNIKVCNYRVACYRNRDKKKGDSFLSILDKPAFIIYLLIPYHPIHLFIPEEVVVFMNSLAFFT